MSAASHPACERPVIRTLYLCYFGVHEPLVQTQVLPYLRRLNAAGIDVSLLTFDPPGRPPVTDQDRRACRDHLAAEGIRWSSLTYHKRPTLPATLYDILVGTGMAVSLVRRYRINVLHGRGHVAAAIGALTKALCGGRLIFDIRGLLAEEYVDAGRWRANGSLYRWTKAAERHLLRGSDGFVVLTEKAREVLFPGCSDRDRAGRPIEVIPCCTDLQRFRDITPAARAEMRRALGLADRRVIAYVGALGGWYMTREMVECLATACRQDPSTFCLILTQSPPELISGPLQERGIAPRDVLIRAVSPDQVPRYLQAADLALSFRSSQPCHSMLASSPTKLAEYLASGLPVVCTAGIGDVDAIVEHDRVGVLIREFHEAAYLQALREVEMLRRERGIAERCRASARRRFDLESIGAARYRRLYDRLFDPSPARPPATDAPGDHAKGAGPEPRRPISVCALVPYPKDTTPSQRFRVEQWLPYLREQGISVDLVPFATGRLWRILHQPGRHAEKALYHLVAFMRRLTVLPSLPRYDVALIHRAACIAGPAIVERLISILGCPVIFDFDDAIHLLHTTEANRRFGWLKFPGKTAVLCRLSTHVVVGNEELAAYARRFHDRVTIVPSSVDTGLYRPRPRTSSNTRVVIGWTGSSTSQTYLERFAPVLRELAGIRDVEIRVHSNREPMLPGVPCVWRPWHPETEVEELSRFDIGIMPLPDTPWARGKCALKALQYMALGIPAVCSAIGTNCRVIKHGENGLLASTPDQWLSQLARLIDDPALRERLGREGRRTVEDSYSMPDCAARFERVVREVVGGT